MKPGTIVQLEDGRMGTVVYHNLDGYGIIFGKQKVNPNELPEPEAMLRNGYPSAQYPCVGNNYKIIEKGKFV